MVSLVAATGDLFVTTARARVTLSHLRRTLRFRPYVSPEPTLEDLEGRAVILHPAHVRTFLVVPREPLEECLADLVWKTVHLLVNCPPVAPKPADEFLALATSESKHSRLLLDGKLPFAFDPGDYLAIVRIKPAHGRGETIGVLDRTAVGVAGRLGADRPLPVLSVLDVPEVRIPDDAVSELPATSASRQPSSSLRC